MLVLKTNKNSGEDTFRWTAEEGKAIDAILLDNYYLIEDRYREALSDLYSHKKFSTGKEREIVCSIREGFEDNERLLKK